MHSHFPKNPCRFYAFGHIGSVFSTLLVFNMVFARMILKEPLTSCRIGGSVTILVGVCLVVIATPLGIPTDFSPEEVVRLLSRPEGATWIAVLLSLVIFSIFVIRAYERRYPLRLPPGNRDKPETKSLPLPKFPRADSIDPNPGKSISVTQQSSVVDMLSRETQLRSPLRPQEWLDNVMGFVYPGSLGLDEGVCHLTMKASLSMYVNCGREGQGGCNHWVIYVTTIVWITASLATLWWLKTVFQRYQTTLALPIEYGMVNVASVCSGLLFFDEASFLNSWQLGVIITGLLVILGGILLGRVGAASHSQEPSNH
ncbi:hypothetical protein AAMO2058_001148300 [Amorphochlora amoebiformis]